MNDNWQADMNVMLEMIEKQAELSLRKISAQFEMSNRTFTDEFRQYFFKMSMQRYTHKMRSLIITILYFILFSLVSKINTNFYGFPLFKRLDISYTKVEMEQWNKHQAGGSENSSSLDEDHQLRKSTSHMMHVHLRKH